MPGLYGDILTSLIAVRAVAEHYDSPVTLKISHHFATLAPLIEKQDYIEAMIASEWNLAETGPVYTYERIHQSLGNAYKPLEETPGFDKVCHLQYRGWPHPTCYEDCARNAEEDLELNQGELRLEPNRPWISRERYPNETAAAILSSRIVGNWRQGDKDKPQFLEIMKEIGGIYVAAPNESIPPEFEDMTYHADWVDTARIFSTARAWVGNQSAPWVLANALHCSKILTMEPDSRRHDVTFWLPTPGNRRIGMSVAEIRDALAN